MQITLHRVEPSIVRALRGSAARRIEFSADAVSGSGWWISNYGSDCAGTRFDAEIDHEAIVDFVRGANAAAADSIVALATPCHFRVTGVVSQVVATEGGHDITVVVEACGVRFDLPSWELHAPLPIGGERVAFTAIDVSFRDTNM